MLYQSERQNRTNRLLSWIGGWVLARIANLAVFAVLAIFVFIAWKSLPFLRLGRFGEMFGSSHWFPERAEPEFGMLAMFYGSFLVTAGAMLIAIPLSLLTAVVLSDMVSFRVRQWAKPILELLAAIPSVAFGFFAIKVLAPWLQTTFGLPSGTNALNASLILAIMATPTIVSVAEDALVSLGRELREASYALGATRFETIVKVILPAAKNGVLTAIVLGMMRAIGETMVVWMAAGNASNVPRPWYDLEAVFGSFFEAVRTMTATIAGDMGETSADSMHRSALFAVGLVLLVFTFGLNLLTESFARSRPGGGSVPGLGKVTAIYDSLMHVWIRLIGPKNHRRLRTAANAAFSGVGFFSIGFLAFVLILVLGPMLMQGREAVLFRGTIEHRLFLAERFNRGNLPSVQAEYERCQAVRRPVYETLERFAWLDPQPLLEQVAKWDRTSREENKEQIARIQHELEVLPDETARAGLEQNLLEAKKQTKEADRASKRLVRAFNAMCETDDPEKLNAEYERLNDLAGTPRSNLTPILEAARKYHESAKTANLALRNEPTPVDPSRTFTQAFRELRNQIVGSDGNGALLGPENREDTAHLPPEVRYGTTHWVMSRRYNDALQQATVWQPRFDAEGTILQNLETRIDRRDFFRTPGLEGIPAMLDLIDTNLAAMLAPHWTLYWGYFFDGSTAGHFLGGIGPELLGTLLVTFFSILFALPIGVATAAHLVEAAKDGFSTRMIRLGISTLAGVPSIVFGLFGLAIIVRYLTGTPCILAGSLTLALLILPLIIRASEEAIRAVPQTFREAALGLGASPVRCFLTVTLPASLPGILTGTILAMSRAAGETAPLLFTCAVASGKIANWFNPLWSPTPVLSYSAYDIAVGDRLAEMVPYNQYGLVGALILLVLVLNLGAILLRGRIARRLRGG